MSCASLVQWKEEPLSPLSNEELTWLSEDTIYQTPQELENCKFEDDEYVPCETKAEVASLVLENLENLIDLDELIKEEPFLLDEKMLPILEDVEQVPILHPAKMEYVRSPDTTQFLLKEFETVYDVVEFAHETLTPPQSPPADNKILTTLEPLLTFQESNKLQQQSPVQAAAYQQAQEKQFVPFVGYAAQQPPTPQPDIAQELAMVDELVRTRVEDMQWTYSGSSSGPSSPNSNSNSSGSSNFGDCSSDDPEWMPEPVEELADDGTPSKSRKRAKPYSRTSSTVDKKSRKKEQNKNAATRYRMKKKAEVEVILTEEKQLSVQNEELETKIKDMQREIKYLKGLMRDLFKAKGLIN